MRASRVAGGGVAGSAPEPLAAVWSAAPRSDALKNILMRIKAGQAPLLIYRLRCCYGRCAAALGSDFGRKLDVDLLGVGPCRGERKARVGSTGMLRAERYTRRRSERSENRGLPTIQPGWGAQSSVNYTSLSNQQLMLEDEQRTACYRAAIVGNRSDFEGRTVLDVGAGTGILSMFAAQAGARKVYACERTSSAEYARMLVRTNNLGDTIEVVETSLEELRLPEKVDVIVSEPLGFALFHEQMINVFLEARDRFLAPSGKMFPTTGRLWFAPFTDAVLYFGRQAKSDFWQQRDFHGVDLRGVSELARLESFGMPAICRFDEGCLMASPVAFEIDFRTCPLADLALIALPFHFTATRAGTIHGLATWFDVAFEGSTDRVVLSTAPDQPTTHWAQTLFVLAEPIDVRVGQELRGVVQLEANTESSYDVLLEGELVGSRSFSQVFLLQSYSAWSPPEHLRRLSRYGFRRSTPGD
jgi:predicted RNA methylase